MPCNCGNKQKEQAKVFVVRAPDGSTKSYRSEIEASAAAKRVGGTYKAA